MKKIVAVLSLTLGASCATTSWVTTEALPTLLASPQLVTAVTDDVASLVGWGLDRVPYGLGSFVKPYIMRFLNEQVQPEVE